MIGHLIAIEGPDGAGKDSFVSGLFEYLNQYVPHCIDSDDKAEFKFKVSEETKAAILINTHTTWPNSSCPLGATGLKVKFVNLREGSQQSSKFMAAIHSGEITDPVAIADGYLELHWAYFKYVMECLSHYDLVIMNRSLMSFKALQIDTLQVPGVLAKYYKLKSLTNQSEIKHYVMLPEKEVIVQRASSKTVSVLDEMFTKRIDSVYDSYVRMSGVGSGFEDVNFVTGTSHEDYADTYKQIVFSTISNIFKTKRK